MKNLKVRFIISLLVFGCIIAVGCSNSDRISGKSTEIVIAQDGGDSRHPHGPIHGPKDGPKNGGDGDGGDSLAKGSLIIKNHQNQLGNSFNKD